MSDIGEPGGVTSQLLRLAHGAELVEIVDDRESPLRSAQVLSVEILYVGCDVALRIIAKDLRKNAHAQPQQIREAMERNADRIERTAAEIEC